MNDFRVSRQRVLEALVNLKKQPVENSEALEALPEDGELEDLYVVRGDNDDAYFKDISPVGSNADEAKEQKDTNKEEDDPVHFSHSVLNSAALNLTKRFCLISLSTVLKTTLSMNMWKRKEIAPSKIVTSRAI